MSSGKIWHFAAVFALTVCGSHAARAYTRAYLTNGTGSTVYGLHVKLKNPALAGSQWAGVSAKVFNQSVLSVDGTNLVFFDPVSSQGISNGTSIWAGWEAANADLPADVFVYWWTDLDGNMVGTVQTYDPTTGTDSTDPGTFSPLSGSLSGTGGGSGGGSSGGSGSGTGGGSGGLGGKAGPSGFDGPTGGGTGGNGGNGGPDSPYLLATPEVGTLGTIACGLGLIGLGAVRRRRTTNQ